MPDPGKLRWFRFRLRTALAGFAIVALWLGWSTHVVRQRRAALDELREKEDVEYFTTFSCQEPEDWERPKNIPYIRYLLGDVSVEVISLRRPPSKSLADEMERLGRLFPEAIVDRLKTWEEIQRERIKVHPAE
jgi:hypothetical protein